MTSTIQLVRILIFLTLFALLNIAEVFATHIRGGEITARRDQRNPLRYFFTLTIYTFEGVGVADDPTNTLFFGDGNSQTSPRAAEILIDPVNNTTRNTYEFSHVYNSPGEYKVYYVGDNRNAFIENIANSVLNNFYVETKIIVGDPFLGINNTPVLLTPAYDLGALNQLFTHNPGAYDPDGDSLSFKLTICRQFDYLLNQPISTSFFIYPNQVATGGLNENQTGPATFTIDAQTGDLIWDVPREVNAAGGEGMYNAAFYIYEWRGGDTIGYVVRDMQIIIEENDNRRPRLIIPNDTCIIANRLIDVNIKATDPDTNESLTITADGQTFYLPDPQAKSTFSFNPAAQPPVAVGRYRWRPSCLSVRAQPYAVQFKARDRAWNLNDFLALSDLKTWRIKVVGQPPLLDSAVAKLGAINLYWKPYSCQGADSIEIWRKNDSTVISDSCDTEILIPLGYTRIAALPISDSTYTDKGAIEGLKRGFKYCYRLRAKWPSPGNGRSIPGNEHCVYMPLDIPVIINTSVLTTKPDSGKILVKWVRPLELDTNKFVAPYKIELIRNSATTTNNVVFTTNSLTDTTFIDSALNTFALQYQYRLRFYYTSPLGQLVLADSAEPAQSIRLSATPLVNAIQLNWVGITPWQNSNLPHYIFREAENNFILIDSVLGNNPTTTYTDVGADLPNGLEYGKKYCYFVTTQGAFSHPKLPTRTLNNSQVICATTRDTLIPCVPNIISDAPINQIDCYDCNYFKQNESFENKLQWNRATITGDCQDPQVIYLVYFAPYNDIETQLIDSTPDTIYVHRNLKTVAGCYQIAAKDPSGNVSPKSDKICTDNCAVFNVPNIISPNGDQWNQLFEPFCRYNPFIRSLEFKVYNRWGTLVYKSNDKTNIDWPGVNNAGKKLSDGVYYYYIDIDFVRVDRKNERTQLKGWIQVIR